MIPGIDDLTIFKQVNFVGFEGSLSSVSNY